MKYLFSAILLILSFLVNAQKHENLLLSPEFWKSKPDVKQVEEAIAKGNDPAELNSASFDPVVFAINNNCPEETILFLLQEKGNSIHKITHDSRTYLFWAAMAGNVEIVKYLLAKGAKIDLEDSHGFSPMAFAANAGQQNTIIYDLLIAAGADVRARNRSGATLMMLVAPTDTALKMIQYFSQKGLSVLDVDQDGNTLFNYAAKGGNIALLQKLINQKIPFNDQAVLMAAQGMRRHANGVEVFEFLESLKLNLWVRSKTGENALHYIVRKPNQQKVVKFFLDKGIDVNQLNEQGNNVFMQAMASGDLETLKLLYPYVKNINHKNSSGQSALSLAVNGSSFAVMEWVMEKGADIQVEDAKGNNLAYYLLSSYNPRWEKDFDDKLQLLMAKGLNITQPQKNGNTACHLAVEKNNISLLQKMIALRPDINAKNKEGYTALHKAAMLSRNTALVELLLANGADKKSLTDFGETAFDLAQENEHFSKGNISVDFLK